MAEPITLEEAKAHCRVTADDEDGLLTALIIAAREWVENFTGLILVEREITQRFDGFANSLKLYAWPINPGATIAVGYVDADGADQTVTSPILSLDNRSAYVIAPLEESWPITYRAPGAVSVTVTAGYTDPEDVPQSLKQAMLLLIGHWFASREAVVVGSPPAEVPLAVEALSRPYRLPVIG